MDIKELKDGEEYTWIDSSGRAFGHCERCRYMAALVGNRLTAYKGRLLCDECFAVEVKYNQAVEVTLGAGQAKGRG